jgi:hypothetical protein
MSLLGGKDGRPPDYGEKLKAVADELFLDLETQIGRLQQKADQSKRLRPICIESDNIWREIQRLFRQEPVRVLSVGEHIMKYHDVLLSVHESIDRCPDLTSEDIKEYSHEMRDILIAIRERGRSRNQSLRCTETPGTTIAIVQGAENVNMSGVDCTINYYNVGPELVPSLEKKFRHLYYFIVFLF